MRTRALGLLAATTTAAAMAVALPAAAQVTRCETGVVRIGGDINGDGVSDLAVGVPNRVDDTGGVDLKFLSTSTPDRVLTRSNAGLGAGSPGDRFGAAVTLGDLNDDDCNEIIVGAPGARGEAGSVYVVFGATSGFQSVGGLALNGGSTAGDRFGSALAVMPDRDRTRLDLWVGAPFDDVAGMPNAGSVTQYAVTPTAAGDDVTVTQVAIITQNSPGVPGSAEPGDHFGAVLSATQFGLFIGVPDEDIGGRSNAGLLTLLKTTDEDPEFDQASSWSQASPGVAGEPEAGDRFGASVNALFGFAIAGVPGEDIGPRSDAGMVQTFRPTSITDVAPARGVTQDSPGIPGAVEAGDRFGAAVVLGRQLTCTSESAIQAVVGAPFEDITVGGDAKTNAGTVVVFTVSSLGPCPARGINQQTALPGSPEDGDHLGSTVALGRNSFESSDDDIPDRVFIGVPGENVGSTVDAGIVQSTRSPIGSAPMTFRYTGGTFPGFHYGSVLASPVGDAPTPP